MIAMVTFYGIKMIKTCWTINVHLFDIIFMDTNENGVVASIPQRISIKNVRKLLWATLKLVR